MKTRNEWLSSSYLKAMMHNEPRSPVMVTCHILPTVLMTLRLVTCHGQKCLKRKGKVSDKKREK